MSSLQSLSPLSSVLESLRAAYGAEAFASAIALISSAAPLPKAAAPLPMAAAPLPMAAAPLPMAAAPVPKAASASAEEGAPKRRGPKKLVDMTPEQLEAHQARKAERSAKKAEEAEAAAAVAAGEPAEAPVKRKGRIWTPEQKEAAKAKRAQTMAAKKAAASEPVDLSSGLQGDWAILSSRPPSPDVSFYPHTIDGVSFFTNDRGDLVTESFEWVGRLVGGKIDEGVLEPADLAHATMRA